MNKMKPEPLTDDMCSCRWPIRKLLGVGKSMGVLDYVICHMITNAY